MVSTTRFPSVLSKSLPDKAWVGMAYRASAARASPTTRKRLARRLRRGEIDIRAPWEGRPKDVAEQGPQRNSGRPGRDRGGAETAALSELALRRFAGSRIGHMAPSPRPTGR